MDDSAGVMDCTRVSFDNPIITVYTAVNRGSPMAAGVIMLQ